VDTESTREATVGAKAGRQQRCVKAVPLRNEDAEFVASDGVLADEVKDASRIGQGELPQCGGQIADVDWATDIVREQGPVPPGSGQGVHHALVLGLAIADNQRGPCDDGARVQEPCGGLGRRLRRPVSRYRVG
jgi:hypothetical protein